MTPHARWSLSWVLAIAWTWFPQAPMAAEPAQRTAINELLQSLARAMSAGDSQLTLAAYDPSNSELAASVARDVGALRGRAGLDVSLRLAHLDSTANAAAAVVLRTIRYDEHQRRQLERRWLTMQLQRTTSGWRIGGEAERDSARTISNDLSIELMPEQGRLRGQALLKVSISAAGTDGLLLELNRGLEVTELVDERGRPLRFEREGSSILVLQPRGLRAGESRVLNVSFAGSLFNERKEQGYSQVALSPRGSFASWVTKWYPRLAGNGSKSQGRLRYLVPTGVTVASNGRLNGVETQAGGDVYSFTVERPLDFSFAAARYLHRTARVDGIELGIYLLSGTEDKLELYLQETARTLRAQRALHGTYPFDGYAVVEIPSEATGKLGGSGEQGMNLFPVGTLPDRSFPLPLVAHEMGHSWWGNLVKAEDSAMLDEGLAQFSALWCVLALDGEAAMRNFLRRGYPNFPQSAQSYFARFASSGRDYPLGLPPNTAEAAAALHDLADTKGMLVYSMLRDSIGSEAMAQGLRELARQFADKSMTLADLQRAWQKSSGRNLEEFFQQWLFRTGAPELILNATTTATARGFVTSGTVLQAGESYALDVEIVLASPATKVVHTLHLQEAATTFSFSSDSKPDWVVLDPEYKVLRWTPELRHARLLDEGRVLTSLGREAAAVAKLEEYVQRAPDSLAGRAQLGIALEARSQLRAAEQHYRHVLDYHRSVQVFEPAVSLSQLHLGYVLDLAGRRDAALAAYQQTLALPNESDSHQAARLAIATPHVLPARVAGPLRATLLRFAGDYDNRNGIAVSVRVNEQDVLQMGQGAAATSLEWIEGARFRLPGSSTLVEFSGAPTSTMLILSVGDTVIRVPRKQ